MINDILTHLILCHVSYLSVLGEVLDDLLLLLQLVAGHEEAGGSPVQLVAARAESEASQPSASTSQHGASGRTETFLLRIISKETFIEVMFVQGITMKMSFKQLLIKNSSI